MRPLIIVRPEPGARDTAEAARKLGLAPVVMPFFAIEPVEWEAPAAEAFDGLLFTSANALRFGGGSLQCLRTLPAYCVGEATAAAARECGFDVETAGSRGVDALLETLPSRLKLLHLCGEDWRQPASSTQSIDHLPVYRSAELSTRSTLNRIAGAVVAVHSPRAASTLARAVDAANVDRRRIAIAAISSAAAEAAGGEWEVVETAGSPTDAALLAIASRLCNNRG